MPQPDGSMWSKQYADPRCDVRVLVSMPRAMQLDAQQLAARQGVSFAELVRQLLTREIVLPMSKPSQP